MRRTPQGVYAVQVRDNKILVRNHTQLQPRATNPSGRALTFQFTARHLDFNDDSEEDDYTVERILTYKLGPSARGEGCTRFTGKELPFCWKRGSF